MSSVAHSLLGLLAFIALAPPAHAATSVVPDGGGGFWASVSGPAVAAPLLGYVARCHVTPREYPMSSPRKDALEDAAYDRAWALAEAHCPVGVGAVTDARSSSSTWTSTSASCERGLGKVTSVPVEVEVFTAGYSLHFSCNAQPAEQPEDSDYLYMDPQVAACMEEGAQYGWSQAYCELTVGGGSVSSPPPAHTATKPAPYGKADAALVMCSFALGSSCVKPQGVQYSSGGWYTPPSAPTGYFTFDNGMGAADPNPMHNPLLNWFIW